MGSTTNYQFASLFGSITLGIGCDREHRSIFDQTAAFSLPSPVVCLVLLLIEAEATCAVLSLMKHLYSVLFEASRCQAVSVIPTHLPGPFGTCPLFTRASLNLRSGCWSTLIGASVQNSRGSGQVMHDCAAPASKFKVDAPWLSSEQKIGLLHSSSFTYGTCLNSSTCGVMPEDQCVDCGSGSLAAAHRSDLPPPEATNTSSFDHDRDSLMGSLDGNDNVRCRPLVGSSIDSRGNQQLRKRWSPRPYAKCQPRIPRDSKGADSGSHDLPSQTTVPPIEPTIYDAPARDFFDNTVSDLPYTHYLQGLEDVIPGVSGLVDIIAESRRESRNSGHQSPRPYIPGEHIIVGEILKEDPHVRWHDIDCADARSLRKHSDVLSGKANRGDASFRYLVLDDVSCRAIEVLGSNLGVDPRVFTKHLHQSLNGFSVETMEPESGKMVQNQGIDEMDPRYNFIGTSALRLGQDLANEESHIYQVTLSTDVFLVPASLPSMRKIPFNQQFEDFQMKRFPHDLYGRFKEVGQQLTSRSSMVPSISEDIGPYLPSFSLLESAIPRIAPSQRITLERFDTATLYACPNTETPTGKQQLPRA